MNNIGRTITDSYCNGFFGRDFDMNDSIIEAEGYDWIVVRRESGEADFARFSRGWKLEQKQQLIDEWCSK